MLAASTARPAVVAGTAVAAAAHLPVISPHLIKAPYMGALFILLTAALVVTAEAAMVSDRLVVAAAAVAVPAAAVVGYVASRVVAFPQLADDVGNWFEPLGVLSVASECLTVLAGAWWLHSHQPSRQPRS